MNILEITNLNKSFGSNEVIRNLSFSVPEHSIFGFIGQNGAGKTTTMKMILGLLKPDSGEIVVNKQRVTFGQSNANEFIGYLPDVPEFYGFMNPKEYLHMCGRITGISPENIRKKSAELIALTGLGNANKRIHSFSRGMKQRLGIAQALLNSPKLLVCDEPTSALDPIGRKEILDILCSVKGHTTVLFSTHILSDVERICDHIAYLHEGTLALDGTLEEVKKMRKGDSIEIEFQNRKDMDLFLEIYPGGIRKSETMLLFSKKNRDDMVKIMAELARNHLSVLRLENLEPTLEDLFLEVAGK